MKLHTNPPPTCLLVPHPVDGQCGLLRCLKKTIRRDGFLLCRLFLPHARKELFFLSSTAGTTDLRILPGTGIFQVDRD